MARITSSESLKVDGLNELNRALRELGGKELQKELRAASKKVATFVAADAKSAAYSLGGVAAKVAPSIKPSAGTTSAGVRFGGAGYPMAGGAEFGAIRFKQFQPWRGNSTDAGYFVYPAIRQDMDRVVTEYYGAVDSILERNGLK